MTKGERTKWTYLLAIVLLAHGVGQMMPLLAAWTNIKMFANASWIFSSGGGMRTPVGQAFPLLGLLALLGYHRGGWYTNARLDKMLWHIDNPSADRILPQFQRLEVGDTIPDGPEGTARFTIAAITPDRLLALHDPDGTHIPHTNFSWTFVLREIEPASTRLILRTRATFPRRWLATPLAYFALGPADFLMAHEMLLRGIKERAERTSASDISARAVSAKDSAPV